MWRMGRPCRHWIQGNAWWDGALQAEPNVEGDRTLEYALAFNLLRGFNPRRDRQYSFVEIDHEIFSTVILSLPLIQEGQLSFSGERMCTILVNCLED